MPKEWVFQLEFRIKADFQSEGDQAGEIPFAWGRSAFWFTQDSIDWMRPTHIIEDNLPNTVYHSEVDLIQNHPRRHDQCAVWMPLWPSLPGGTSSKEFTPQSRRHERCGFHPWVGKIPWGRKWQPTPVFLPGESMDRGAWWATVHRFAKSQSWLKHPSKHAHAWPHQVDTENQPSPLPIDRGSLYP